MLFENVLNVNEISSIITDTLYIVWLALKQERVQPEDGHSKYKLCLTVLPPYCDLINTTGMSHLKGTRLLVS